MYYVYVLKSLVDGNLYIGYTANDPITRLEKHNSGNVQSTKFRKPLELIYYEAYLNNNDALGREKFLKSGSGHKYLNKQLKNYMIGLNEK